MIEACSTYGLLSREIYLFILFIFYVMLIVKLFLIYYVPRYTVASQNSTDQILFHLEVI